MADQQIFKKLWGYHRGNLELLGRSPGVQFVYGADGLVYAVTADGRRQLAGRLVRPDPVAAREGKPDSEAPDEPTVVKEPQ